MIICLSVTSFFTTVSCSCSSACFRFVSYWILLTLRSFPCFSSSSCFSTDRWYSATGASLTNSGRAAGRVFLSSIEKYCCSSSNVLISFPLTPICSDSATLLRFLLFSVNFFISALFSSLSAIWLTNLSCSSFMMLCYVCCCCISFLAFFTYSSKSLFCC